MARRNRRRRRVDGEGGLGAGLRVLAEVAVHGAGPRFEPRDVAEEEGGGGGGGGGGAEAR